MKRLIFLTLGLIVLSGCATYNYAHKVKTISFDDNVTKGQSAGSIRGEDCTWTVLGSPLGSQPTIDKAFINAQTQAGSVAAAGFGSIQKNEQKQIRYINNATTSNDGFNALLFGKQCIVVTGIGYR